MTIDITSFFFNSSITEGVATSAWGTSIGQKKSNECRIEDENPGVLELLTGMLYKSIADKSRVDLSAGSLNREILLCSLFEKIFINDVQIENESFVLTLVRERSKSHDGRLLISYPPYAKLDGISINQNTINAMTRSLGCTPQGCWFVHNISIKNQDELHFSAIIVDKNQPKIYEGTSKTRSIEWNNLVETKIEYNLEKLGEVLKAMYNGADYGKQVATLYLFVFLYAEHLIDIYKSAEVIKAAGLNSSYSTEIDKAYNVYRLWIRSRIKTPKFSYADLPNQEIFYGSPGTGKSFKVKKLLKERYNIIEEPSDKRRNCERVFRTTFHPDMDYYSFVGSYKPTLKDDNSNSTKSISYEFIPQIFTLAYVEAWNRLDKAEPVCLIIEEINRGNCAQIFGDLFQLLDRKNDGYSEYQVKADTDLYNYLISLEGWGKDHPGILNGNLCLPPNLNIIATMNTSDQSLFPMDSAFKRRWEWKYIPTTAPVGEEFDITIDAGDKEYSWKLFLEKINEMILRATNSEDKQLGFWFVKADKSTKQIPTSTFVSKVVFYLWNDVFKDMGAKGTNPFTISYEGKNEIMSFNSFFEIKPDGKIAENIGVLHSFLKNVGLEPK